MRWQYYISKYLSRISPSAERIFNIATNRVHYWFMTPEQRAQDDEMKRFWDGMTPRQRIIWWQWGKKP